jgi:hypothetical protein
MVASPQGSPLSLKSKPASLGKGAHPFFGAISGPGMSQSAYLKERGGWRKDIGKGRYLAWSSRERCFPDTRNVRGRLRLELSFSCMEGQRIVVRPTELHRALALCTHAHADLGSKPVRLSSS